jgi:hypothetical protein
MYLGLLSTHRKQMCIEKIIRRSACGGNARCFRWYVQICIKPHKPEMLRLMKTINKQFLKHHNMDFGKWR